MRAEYAQCGKRKIWRPCQKDVETAHDEVGRTDGAAKRLRLLTEDPSECDWSQSCTDATGAVQNPDAAGTGAPDGKNPLAEDGQQEEHSPRQAPTRLHEHQRAHVGF